MDREAIEKSLLKMTGGKPWISKRKLREWYGLGDRKLEEFLRGIDYRKDGNRTIFFVPDVVNQVINKERIKHYGW